MSKFLLLLVLNLVAATQNGNNGSESQTNATDAGEEPQEPPNTSFDPNEELFLITENDVDLFNQDIIINELLQSIVQRMQMICATVASLVDPSDNNCPCIKYTTIRDVTECKNNVKPTVQKVTEKDPDSDEMRGVSCGPKDREGSMFSFGYNACDVREHMNKIPLQLPLLKQENKEFFEVYKFCHSKKDNEVIYTEHIIHNAEFLTGPAQKIQQQQDGNYNIMSNGFNYFGSRYETIKKSYQRLKQNNNEEIREFPATKTAEDLKNKIDSLVKAQQLVPVNDMAFTLTRRPTYHYLNIAPMQFDSISLWDYMSDLIRQDARKNKRIYTINTGAFIINPREKKESTEIDIEEVDVWIKMIRYEKQASTPEERGQMESFAIVMNAGLDKTKLKEFNDELCPDNLCENAFASFKVFSKCRYLVRCCPTKKIAEKFFDKELGTEYSFNIEEFTKRERMKLSEELAYLEFFPRLM